MNHAVLPEPRGFIEKNPHRYVADGFGVWVREALFHDLPHLVFANR